MPKPGHACATVRETAASIFGSISSTISSPFTSSTSWRSNITGVTTSQTLTLACHFCNRHKGPNLAGMDSTTGELTRLFNPRTDTWNQHFRIQAGRVIGLTPVGRTTVYVLNMNRPDRVRVRIELEPETFL